LPVSGGGAAGPGVDGAVRHAPRASRESRRAAVLAVVVTRDTGRMEIGHRA
jgi:hypothetical protein